MAIVFAHATGRTLVMPPMMVFYLLNKDSHGEDNQSTFDKFFDMRRLSEALDIITMDEFIRTVAAANLLKVHFVAFFLPRLTRFSVRLPSHPSSPSPPPTC